MFEWDSYAIRTTEARGTHNTTDSTDKNWLGKLIFIHITRTPLNFLYNILGQRLLPEWAHYLKRF